MGSFRQTFITNTHSFTYKEMKAVLILGLSLMISSNMATFLNRRAYTPYRPYRWVPRAFWNPDKRGINSAGIRPYLSRYHRSDPGLEYVDYPELAADEAPVYVGLMDKELEDLKEKRGGYGSKYKDNKAYGFWISALNKAGNYKRSNIQETEGEQ